MQPLAGGHAPAMATQAAGRNATPSRRNSQRMTTHRPGSGVSRRYLSRLRAYWSSAFRSADADDGDGNALPGAYMVGSTQMQQLAPIYASPRSRSSSWSVDVDSLSRIAPGGRLRSTAAGYRGWPPASADVRYYRC